MMRAMKQLGMTAAIIGTMSAAPVLAQEIPADASNFYKSESVTVRQVTFPNQYNMNIAGNLFLPRIWIRRRNTPRSSSGIPWAR